jgi:acetyl esterase
MSKFEDLSSESDPRFVQYLDPRILRAMSKFGLNKTASPPQLNLAASLEEKISFFNDREKGYQPLFDAVFASESADYEGVSTEVVSITGIDGNEITLYIHTPTNRAPSTSIPCLYHIHGGGMSIFTAKDLLYVHTRSKLAALGVVVVGIEFRNAAGKLGPHHFPAG